jgi:hypothetical protein
MPITALFPFHLNRIRCRSAESLLSQSFQSLCSIPAHPGSHKLALMTLSGMVGTLLCG